MPRSLRTLVVAFALALSACVSISRSTPAPSGYNEVSDKLFFGRSIPGGGEVSDAEWDAFVREVITPAFPGGFSVFTGRGQWLGADGVIAREISMTFEVVHPPDVTVDAKIQRIAEEYKRRFRQEAVLRVTTPAAVKFFQQ